MCRDLREPRIAQIVLDLAAFPDSILVSCCAVSRHVRGENYPARLEQALEPVEDTATGALQN